MLIRLGTAFQVICIYICAICRLNWQSGNIIINIFEISNPNIPKKFIQLKNDVDNNDNDKNNKNNNNKNNNLLQIMFIHFLNQIK